MKTLCYRLGAWLLREHVAAAVLHYEQERESALGRNDINSAEHCAYISIGLKYAIARPWRYLDHYHS